MIENNTVSAESLIARGKSAMVAQDYEDAMKLFEQALDKDPSNQDAQECLTDARLKRKQKVSDRIRDLVSKGKQAAQEERYDDARVSFELSLQLSEDVKDLPDIKLLIQQERVQALLSEVTELGTINASVRRAGQKLNDGDYEDALRELEELPPTKVNELRQKIIDTKELLGKGKTSLKTSQYEEAIRAFDQVLRIAPDDRRAMNYRSQAGYQLSIQSGENDLNLGNLESAIEKFKDALKWKPGDSYAAERLQKTEEAINIEKELSQQFERAKLAYENGDYLDAENILANILNVDSKRQEVSEFLSKVKIARQQALSDVAKLKISEARQLLAINNYAEAEKPVREVLLENQDSLEARQILDEIKRRIQSRQRSDDAYQAALAAYKAKNLDGAESRLVEAMEDPTDPTSVKSLKLDILYQKLILELQSLLERKLYPRMTDRLSQIDKDWSDRSEIKMLRSQMELGRKLLDAELAFQGHDADRAVEILTKLQTEHDLSDEHKKLLENALHRQKQTRDAKSYLQRGVSAYKVNDFDEAVRYYDQVLDNEDPGSQAFKDALQKREEAILKQKESTENNIKSRITLAENALSRGDFDTAFMHLKEAEDLDPKKNHLAELAIARGRIEDEKKRKEYITETIKKGQEALLLEDFGQAIKTFENVLKIDRENPQAELGLNQAQIKQKKQIDISESLRKTGVNLRNQQYSSAWENIQIAYSLAPDSDSVQEMVSRIIDRSREDLNVAVQDKDFERALDIGNFLHNSGLGDGQPGNPVRRVEREYEKYQKINQLRGQLHLAVSLEEKVRLLQQILFLTGPEPNLQAEFETVSSQLSKERQLISLLDNAEQDLTDKRFNDAKKSAELARTMASDDSRVLNFLQKWRKEYTSFIEHSFQEAQIYLDKKQYNDAEGCLNRVRHITDDEAVIEKALQMLRSIDSERKLDTLRVEKVSSILSLIRNGSYREAEQMASGALAIQPNDEQLNTLLTNAAQHRQRFEKIQSKLIQSIAARERGDNEAALERIKEIIELDPENKDAQQQLWEIQEDIKRQEVFVQQELALVKNNLENGQVAEARRHLEMVRAVKPNHLSIRELVVSLDEREFNQEMQSGEIALEKKDFDSAIQHFDRAHKIYPEDRKAIADLYDAKRSREIARSEEAKRVFEAAQKAFDKADYYSARSLVSKALELDSGQTDYQEFLTRLNVILEKRKIDVDRTRKIILWVFFGMLLIISLSVFFVLSGPQWIAGMILPTASPTSTPTITATPPYTATPTATATPTPTATYTPSPLPADSLFDSVTIYETYDTNSKIVGTRAKGSIFYLCRKFGEWYQIADLPCSETDIRAGWVQVNKVINRFPGDFPTATPTIMPTP